MTHGVANVIFSNCEWCKVRPQPVTKSKALHRRQAPSPSPSPSPSPTPATNIIINEVDSDTPGTDTQEFVELYDGGVGNTSLSGLVVVFYNGSNDLSYASFNLTGSTDANGYYILGNAAVPGVDQTFGDNLLQNGADAVALYVGNTSSFPTNTADYHDQSPRRFRLRHERC